MKIGDNCKAVVKELEQNDIIITKIQDDLEKVKVEFDNNIKSWAIEDVCKWVEDNDFGDYKDLFEKAEVDGSGLLT
eukprot:UN09085